MLVWVHKKAKWMYLEDARMLFSVSWFVVDGHGNCSPVSGANTTRVSSICHNQCVTLDKSHNLDERYTEGSVIGSKSSLCWSHHSAGCMVAFCQLGITHVLNGSFFKWTGLRSRNEKFDVLRALWELFTGNGRLCITSGQLLLVRCAVAQTLFQLSMCIVAAQPMCSCNMHFMYTSSLLPPPKKILSADLLSYKLWWQGLRQIVKEQWHVCQYISILRCYNCKPYRCTACLWAIVFLWNPPLHYTIRPGRFALLGKVFLIITT